MNKQRFHAPGDVPFAWESNPGKSKVAPGTVDKLPKAAVGKVIAPSLPPPPGPRESPKLLAHGMYIPLPPCPFQDPQSSSCHRSGWKDDPFLAAYMECTRSVKDQEKVPPKQKMRSGGVDSRRKMFGLSCKNALEVVEDSMLRLSPRPSRADVRQRNAVVKRRERESKEHKSLIHQ